MPQHAEETVEAVTLVPHERVQQHTAEQIEDLPQHPEETVEAVTLVPHERVQQHTAEEIEDLPQHAEETVLRQILNLFGSVLLYSFMRD